MQTNECTREFPSALPHYKRKNAHLCHSCKPIKKQYKIQEIPDVIKPSLGTLLAFLNSFDCRGMNDIDYMYLLWLKGEKSTAHLIFSSNQEDIDRLNGLKPHLYTKDTLSKLQLLHDTLANNTKYRDIVSLWHSINDTILGEITTIHRGIHAYMLVGVIKVWSDVLYTLRVQLYSHILNDTSDVDRNWYQHVSWNRLWRELDQLHGRVSIHIILSKLKMFLISYQHLLDDLSIASSIPLHSHVEHTFTDQVSKISRIGAHFNGFKKQYHERIVCDFKSLINPRYFRHRTGHSLQSSEMEDIDAGLVYGRKLNIYDCDDAVFSLMADLLAQLKRFYVSESNHSVVVEDLLRSVGIECLVDLFILFGGCGHFLKKK
eukprot:238005_1